MSEEESDSGPTACDAFEPQAWKKNKCKNCFQSPEKHAMIANGVSNDSLVDKTEPKDKNVAGSGGKSTSMKDKYEQLERDKYKTKEPPPKVLPKSKGQGNLTAMTEMYGSLDRKTGRLPESPSGNIPPPVFPKQYKRQDSDGSLKKSKFGSIENVNQVQVHEIPTPEPGMRKFKFGSMENISVQEKKKEPVQIPIQKGRMEPVKIPIQKGKLEPVQIPIQKGKFGSSENISGKEAAKTGSPLKDKQFELLNKLDSFQNEMKTGKSSKSGPTVIHKQIDGNIDVIKLPAKRLDPVKKEVTGQGNEKDVSNNKLKPRFEKPELKVQDDKSVGKLGLKSPTVDKDPKALKSLKDSLAKSADRKSSEKTTTPTETHPPNKGLLPKSRDQLKPSTLDKSDKTDSNVKGRFNLKDQLLKSPSPEKDKKTLTNFKDRLKSPPNDTEKKSDIPSWKDKLKTNKPPAATLQDKLKTTTQDNDKTGRDKLKLAIKEEEKNTPFSLKDRLKSPPQDKMKTPDKSPLPDTNKNKGFNLKDQLKSSSKEKEPPKQLNDKIPDKSPLPDTNKNKGFNLKDQLKSSSKEKEPPKQLNDRFGKEDSKTKTINYKDQLLKSSDKTVEKDKSKSPVPDNTSSKDKEPSKQPNDKFDKEDTKNKPINYKDQLLKSSEKTFEKDKSKSPVPEKSPPRDKEPPKQLNDRFGKDDTKNKTINYKDQLLKASDKNKNFEKDKSKSPVPEEKNKLPNYKDQLKVKSEKDTKADLKPRLEKSPAKDNDTAKPGITDVRGGLKKASDKDKTPVEVKTDPKSNKFELPSLKSKHQDKSDKTNMSKDVGKDTTDVKNKFELPKLKSKTADTKPESQETTAAKTQLKSDKSHEVKDKDTINDKVQAKDVIKNDTIQKDESTAANKSSKSDTERDFHKESKGEKENLHPVSVEERNMSQTLPQRSDISEGNFDKISADTETVSVDIGDACASGSTRARDKSPLHVDTQVFTSSRTKTAGVNSFAETESLDSTSSKQIGFSGLDINKNKSADKESGQNGDISYGVGDKTSENVDNSRKPSVVYTASDIEKLKAELINMTERCQNLETENEMLSKDLKKKESSENALNKQKDDVENALKGLQNQLKSMEEKCSKLETDNVNLSNDMRASSERNQTKHSDKDCEDGEDRLSAKERLMEDMMEENDQLKQEINELKAEMEEMYDSFRDQEAEEFRELQKELEYTAKNCRILQFKLRKMERKADQVEKDKATYEERLRKLQNQFQDRDAVSHIHSLEDELRMAKEVSVRLHDELDMMEDRRGKVEEENRHLTELLEQADRKQFRLELEVDKLRDKVVDLRQELRTREGGPEGEPRKLNCAEFLALHREVM